LSDSSLMIGITSCRTVWPLLPMSY
jgi:hypothetical protein